MTKTNLGLVEFAKSKLTVPTIYMLGGFGRPLTQANIDRRVKTLKCPHTIKNLTTIQAGLGKYCYDCCGLVKGYLWEDAPGKVRYNDPKGSDQNCAGMYKASSEKGPLETMPDVLGLLVFTQDLGHVGIYIGKDSQGKRQYIESTPAWKKWGVIQSNDSVRKWAYWGKYRFIEYINPKVEPQNIKVGDIVRVSGIGRSTSLGTGRSTGLYKSRMMKVVRIIPEVSHAYGCSTILSAPVGEKGYRYITAYFKSNSIQKE
jgi:hypothetical protein